MERKGNRPGSESWLTHLRWLQPGLGIKRWLILLGCGTVLLSLGIAFGLRESYPLPAYFYYLTLQFIPRDWRSILLGVLGLGCLTWGLWGLNRALLEPFLERDSRSVSTVLYNYRRRARGPKIVAIGGGHGQATLLRGLKNCPAKVTAIVTVADDGGSSGRLRRELGILPPGDFRNCIAALADDESLMTQLLQYRFAAGDGLNGHSFGNLFISALAEITGSFESALEESSRVLAVRGRVLPSSLHPVVLEADVQIPGMAPSRVRGESNIPEPGREVLRVMLDPTDPPAYTEAIKAILEADLIIAGPGSLYTSVLPNLLVPQIGAALRASRAPKVYICNVATQPGETEGYRAEEHLQALERHLGLGLFSAIVVNPEIPSVPLPPHTSWVTPELIERPGLRVIQADLTDANYPWRHNSIKLGQIVMNLIKG